MCAQHGDWLIGGAFCNQNKYGTFLIRTQGLSVSDSFTYDSIFQISSKIVAAEVGDIEEERVLSRTREGRLEPRKGKDVLLMLRSKLLSEINRRSNAKDRIEFVLTGYRDSYGLIVTSGRRYLRLVLKKEATAQELFEIVQTARNIEM